MSSHHLKRGLHKQYLNRAAVEPRFSPTASFPGDPGNGGSDPTTTSDVVPLPISTKIPDPVTTIPANPLPTTTSPTPAPVPTTSTPAPAPAPVTTSSSSVAPPPTTTTSSTTSSTSSTPPAVTTPSTTATAASTTLPVGTIVQTYSVPSISSSAAAASSSSAAPSSSNISTGAVVGGIAAAGVGLAAIFFAGLFFVRKWRRRGEEEGEWNARNFRRQSAVLVDDDDASTHSRFNPRPPTMFERKFMNTPPSQGYGGTQNFGGLAGQGAYNGGHDSYQSFSPGRIISPTSADPMAPMPAYGQSPLGSPVSVAPYESQFDSQGQLARQPSNPNGAYLTRSASSGPQQTMEQVHDAQGQQAGAYLARAPSTGQNFDPNNSAHYVDLSRSSVTPFQAAQYEEITRRLNADPAPVQALNAVREAEEPVSPVRQSMPIPVSQASDVTSYANQPGIPKHISLAPTQENASPESPFADPAQAHSADGHADAIGVATTNEEVTIPTPERARVASTSPTLPVPRAFSPISYDFPTSARPGASPLSSQFAQMQDASEPASPPAAVTRNSAHQPQAQQKRPDTVYSTMYDEEDAYGGI